MTAATDAKRIVAKLAASGPAATLVWSGAGISMDGPSSLPSGWELTDRVFGQLFLPGTLDTILHAHRLMGWETKALVDGRLGVRLPRLETVLGVAEGFYGVRAFDVLDDMRATPPNHLHVLCAEHVAAGGHHFTANFDGAIESVLATRFRLTTDERIEHFHGSLAADPSGRRLGATLQAIECGFDAPTSARLLDFLRARRDWVLLGYSGSDFFDIDPLLAELRGTNALGGTKVLWVAHTDADPFVLEKPGGDVPPLVDHLRFAGAKVDIVAGRTSDVAALLADGWGTRRPRPNSGRSVRPVYVDSSLDERIGATFELYRTLGLHAEVRRMLAEGLPTTVPEASRWAATSSCLWEDGRWSTLRRAWWRQPRSVERSERVGACLWVQGRFLPALIWLDHAQRAEPDPVSQQSLEETAGRVIEHMSRVPGLRSASRALAHRALRSMKAPSRDDGLHVWRRRSDLLSSLSAIASGRPRDGAEAEATRTWFVESGDLSAALSFHHRALRDSPQPGEPGPFLEQFSRAVALGSRNGAWRVLSLPGSECAFTVRDAVVGAIGLEYGWWHRIRVVVDFAVRRAKHVRRSKEWGRRQL